MDLDFVKYLPWIPLVGAVLCAVCAIKPAWRPAAGPISVISILLAFVLAIAVFPAVRDLGAGGWQVVTFFPWIHVGEFTADFAYFMDTLTMVMLFVVTGIGSLVAIYSMGYMAGERGYARYFFAVSLFIFAMTSMVMGGNLIMLYLGWEMVGLASYLLIGYYYHKPSAVEAAKKAFIVNRIGDLGFAMGILTVYWTFGSIHYADILPAAQAMVGQLAETDLAQGAAAAYASATQYETAVMVAPFLLLLGALGKSAQIPFYVWLPDAMEGPSPVSALIHAATMVTSGVYMVARLLPLFEFSPYALPTVAVIGGVTAIFAATIALCQNDLKKIFAYSTVSQLGYMFLGVGVLMPMAGMWHLISHAFFKGLLFLTAGSVMHAMAGQLDIRKMSGLRHKMPVTCWLMFCAVLALAGFPLTSGFFSKDTIIAYTFDWGVGTEEIPGQAMYLVLGVLALITAFITASYGFRAWFRVFWGPEQYEMGEEDHGAEHGAPEPKSPDHGGEHAHGHGQDHGQSHGQSHGHGHHHEPHEMPWWPMNAPLVILAIGALFGGLIGFGFTGDHSYGWIGQMVGESTARSDTAMPYGTTLLGFDLHAAMYVISSVVVIAAIAVAMYLHLLRRDAAERFADAFSPIVTLLENRYYVDQLYDLVVVRPLRFTGYLFYVIDQLIINALVYAVAWIPRLLGMAVRPTQHGALQGYGLGMALGVGAIVVVILMLT